MTHASPALGLAAPRPTFSWFGVRRAAFARRSVATDPESPLISRQNLRRAVVWDRMITVPADALVRSGPAAAATLEPTAPQLERRLGRGGISS